MLGRDRRKRGGAEEGDRGVRENVEGRVERRARLMEDAGERGARPMADGKSGGSPEKTEGPT